MYAWFVVGQLDINAFALPIAAAAANAAVFYVHIRPFAAGAGADKRLSFRPWLWHTYRFWLLFLYWRSKRCR